MHPIIMFIFSIPFMTIMVFITLLCIIKRRNHRSQTEAHAALLQAATRRKLAIRKQSCNLTPPRKRPERSDLTNYHSN